PMLLERSMQAQVLIPMAASLIFGLMTGTFLILFLVPIFYNFYGSILGYMGVPLDDEPMQGDGGSVQQPDDPRTDPDWKIDGQQPAIATRDLGKDEVANDAQQGKLGTSEDGRTGDIGPALG
ncbi:MAG: hypothetical protein AAGA30_19220, partial [Planctomycetota bacterium]